MLRQLQNFAQFRLPFMNERFIKAQGRRQWLSELAGRAVASTRDTRNCTPPLRNPSRKCTRTHIADRACEWRKKVPR